MNELKQKISQTIEQDNCGSEFYFLLNKDGASSIKRVDIDEAASIELKNNFIESIKNNVLENNVLSLIDLSGADERTNAVYRYDLPDIPEELTQLDEVIGSEDFEIFDFSSDDLNSLQGIVIILGSGQNVLALYKHQYPVSLLKRTSFNLIRARNRNRFEKLNDDVLRVNAKFEFMKIGDSYYIFDVKLLERFFGFHDAVKNVASAGIENINNSELVVDVQPLLDRLDDVAFARKLIKASRSSPVLGEIPNREVIAFAQTHPALKGKFKFNDTGDRIRLDTKASQNLFLKLLNDDFLQSELTKRYYDSIAKDSLEAE